MLIQGGGGGGGQDPRYQPRATKPDFSTFLGIFTPPALFGINTNLKLQIFKKIGYPPHNLVSIPTYICQFSDKIKHPPVPLVLWDLVLKHRFK